MKKLIILAILFFAVNAWGNTGCHWELKRILIDRPGSWLTWMSNTDTSVGTIPCSPTNGRGTEEDPLCRDASTQYVINRALKTFIGWEILKFWSEPITDKRNHYPKLEIWLKRKVCE